MSFEMMQLKLVCSKPHELSARLVISPCRDGICFEIRDPQTSIGTLRKKVFPAAPARDTTIDDDPDSS